MPTFSASPIARLRAGCVSAAVALALAGCAGLLARDPLRAHVVGLDPLPGEGFEMRFDVKLRLQNPNDVPLDFDGVALELDVDGRPFATGVSDRKGSVPRYGEALLAVPVTVSTVAALRQAARLFEARRPDRLRYVLKGKLGGGPLGPLRFTDKGTLSLPRAIGGDD